MKDDAGKPVRILNPNGFAEWPVRGDERVARVARRVAVRSGQMTRTGHFGSVVLQMTIVVIAVIVSMNMLRSFMAGTPGWVVPLVAFSVTWGFVRLKARWQLDRSADSTSAIMLDEGLCPCCGYNLHGAQSVNDHIVCPECGATWNAARVRSTAPFADQAEMGSGIRMIQTLKHSKQGLWTDDAGMLVPLSGRTLRAARGTTFKGTESRAGIDRVRARVRARSLPLVLTLCAISFVGFCIAAIGWGAGMARFELLLVFGTLTGVIGAVFALRYGIENPWGIKRGMLECGQCPSCAAPISENVDARGFWTCTCGARWKPVQKFRFEA